MFSLRRHALKIIDGRYKNMEQNIAFHLSF